MSGNSELLHNLIPGAELKIFADAGALQMAKIGFMAGAAILGLVAVYILFSQIGAQFGAGNGKRSIGAWIGVLVMGVGAFFMYEKSNGITLLDTGVPLLAITAQNLESGTPGKEWSTPWRNIQQVELVRSVHQQKQSVEQVSEEVHIRFIDASLVQWKQRPEPLPPSVVLDHTPIGVSADELQQALEKVRRGT
jgi:hypothetical protein